MKLIPLLVESLKLFFMEGGFSDKSLHLKVSSPSRVPEVLPPHIKVRVEDKIGRKCRGNAVDLSWLLTAHENLASLSVRDLPSNCHGSMAVTEFSRRIFISL